MRSAVTRVPLGHPQRKEELQMGIGVSIFLIAVGAILRFAVDVQTNGFDLHMVGDILMIVGVIGALFSLIFWSSWGGFARPYDDYDGDDVVVERRRPRRRVVVEKHS
jgi:nitrogen fixation-related uncharacterized protein